jgi:hypothetical protein
MPASAAMTATVEAENPFVARHVVAASSRV